MELKAKLFRKCAMTISVFIFCFLLLKQKFPPVIQSKQYIKSLDRDERKMNRLEGPLPSDDAWLISYLMQNYLTPPSPLPYNLTRKAEQFTKLNIEQFQRSELYKFLVSNFQNHPPGFFIEAGAVDGEYFSNTLWLEIEKKWSGLLIEPNPSNCRSLISRRRKAYISCSCLTPHKYAAQTMLEIPFQHHTIHKGYFWLYRANARSVESRFHNNNDEIQQSSTFSYAPVQCFPLQSYLFALNVTTVDLLSLDTQGGEKNMLLNFPYDKIKIKYIIVEYYKSGANPEGKDEDFVAQMKIKGFRLIKHFENGGNYIFSSL